MLFWLWIACVPDVPLGQADWETTEHDDVLRVTWSAPDATSGEVVWFDELTVPHVATAADLGGGDFEALLLVGAEKSITFEVFTDQGIWATGEAETGGVAMQLLIEDVVGRMSSPTATTVQLGGSWNPVIVDQQGAVRWHYDLPTSTKASLRAHPDEDGMWYSTFNANWDADDPDNESRLVHVSWLGEELASYDLDGHHHDFWVHDDGSIAFIAWEPFVDEAGTEIADDHLWLLQTDGSLTDLFSVAASFPDLVESEARPGENVAWANHIYFDGTDYWLSLRNLDRFVQLGSDGTVKGVIGSDGDWVPDTPFASQHGGMRTDAGLLLHDNDGDGPVRVVEYELTSDGQAKALWTRQPSAAWTSPALGDAVRLPNGNSRISWGVFNTLEEVDTAGESRATVTYDAQVLMGYLRVLPPTY